MDVYDTSDAINLVRRVTTDDIDSDGIADRLLALFCRFPPREPQMAGLSLSQQHFAGTGGLEDFCTTLVYGIALESLNRPRNVSSDKTSGTTDANECPW